MNKEILKQAIPNIISNLSVPMLSLVDIALMGHLSSAHYILAVGFGATLFNFIYWGFGFLRMGTTGFTAQAFGQDHIKKAFYVLFRGMIIAIVIGLLLIVFQKFFLFIGLHFFHTTPEVEAELGLYYGVRIFAAPATLGIYVLTGWFLGMQKARIPMIITIIINIINISGNFYFVSCQGMTANGVALGTVIAQYAGLILGLYFLQAKFPDWKRYLSSTLIFQLKEIIDFLKVNIDIFIRTLCLIFTLAYFKTLSGELGITIGAANIILLEFFTIAAYGIDGFAFAAEAISGKYYGADDTKKLYQSIRFLFYWGMGLGLVFTIIFQIKGQEIILLLTSQPAVIEVANRYLIWMILSPVIMSVAFIWDGVYIGLTASKAMRNTMLIATLCCFIPAQYLFINLWGNHGLWLALIVFFVARGIGQTILSKQILRGNK